MSQGRITSTADHKPEVDRRILRRLRDVVARKHTPQFKLDRIARLLAAGLRVEVCSIYVLGQDNYLELFATWGLPDNIVHKIRIHISEGLVGETARMRASLFVENMHQHESFVYHKETKEEGLKTFLGIPIIRQEKVYGVLVLQTKESISYENREIELLEVASLVIGDILDQSESSFEEESTTHTDSQTKVFRGRLFSKGNPAYGHVLLYGKNLPTYKPLSNRTVAKEKEIFHEALDALKGSLLQVEQDWGKSVKSGEADTIIETYNMLANDPSWHERVEKYIERGFTAAAAVMFVQQDMDHQFSQVSYDASVWVLEDLKDLTNKLLFIIQNERQLVKEQLLKKDVIVVSKSLGPGDLLTLKNCKVKGIIIENGGPNSHAVLLAQSMGIPVLGWVEGIVDALKPTDYVLLDSHGQKAVVNPFPNTLKALEETYSTPFLNSSKTRKLPTKKLQKACHTKGFSVALNVGLAEEIEAVKELPVDGVGLFRTEFLFMEQKEFPTIETQMHCYRRLIENLNGKRCCIRTLDIGSDKSLPYFKIPEEANAALGWRSIRISLDRLTIFRHQLRALLLVSIYGPIDIMFPLIATAEEFFRCYEIFKEEKENMKVDSKYPIRVGIMVETISIYCDLDRLKNKVDFLAVGTNDLFQFFFACDRTNPNIAYRYDPLSYSFLTFLSKLQNKAKKLEFDLSVCGDMGSMKRDVKVLAAMGYRKFSCMLPMAGAIQNELAHMDIKAWEKEVSTYLENPKTPSFRDVLKDKE